MAEKRKQHFVPQFYMRNFSADVERKRFSLYVFDSDRYVSSATIKDQACEDYFYGQAGVEDALGKLEASASPIIAAAITTNTLPELLSDRHVSLLAFVVFQNARTPVMAAGIDEQTEKLVQTVARSIPDLEDEANSISIDDPNTPVLALKLAAEISYFTLDLRWKLLENKTGRLFITSDNPTVRYNQFLEKRNPLAGNTGLASKGLQIFLPLGPRHMLMLYDGDVYRVGGRKYLETHIQIGREDDVSALNELQAANADEVLFFSQDTNGSHVREAVTSASKHRGKGKVEIKEHCAVGPDGRQGTLIQTCNMDLRTGLALDFVGILPSATGPQLNNHPVKLRNPELVHRFELARIAGRPCDARQFVEYFRKR
jgi:hypothetical protein